jgi:hypothetical protein
MCTAAHEYKCKEPTEVAVAFEDLEYNFQRSGTVFTTLHKCIKIASCAATMNHVAVIT